MYITLKNTISAIALDENRVLIAYCASSNSYLTSFICTINNYDITVGTKKTLSYSTKIKNTYPISLVKLSENKVFITFSTYDFYSWAIECTINGTTVTLADKPTQITSQRILNNYISAVALNENKMFISYDAIEDNSLYQLYGVICTINENGITVGTETKLDSVDVSTNNISTILLSNDNVLVIYNKDNENEDNYLYGVFCNTKDNFITVGDIILINNSAMFATFSAGIILSYNKVFIAYGYSNLYGTIINLTDLVQTATKQDTIFGIAQTKALDGQTVKAVRPIYNESEEN